jgi:hypothetical protein
MRSPRASGQTVNLVDWRHTWASWRSPGQVDQVHQVYLNPQVDASLPSGPSFLTLFSLLQFPTGVSANCLHGCRCCPMGACGCVGSSLIPVTACIPKRRGLHSRALADPHSLPRSPPVGPNSLPLRLHSGTPACTPSRRAHSPCTHRPPMDRPAVLFHAPDCLDGVYPHDTSWVRQLRCLHRVVFSIVRGSRTQV